MSSAADFPSGRLVSAAALKVNGIESSESLSKSKGP